MKCCECSKLHRGRSVFICPVSVMETSPALQSRADVAQLKGELVR